MTKRTLLIDGDVVAFQCAAALEQAVEWEPGYWTWSVSFDEVCAAVDESVGRYMQKLDADDYKLCLTDPEKNFRNDVLPTYKGNRKGKRPLVLLYVKQWMVEERGGIMRPGLEGDDVMGILATYQPLKSERIIVSIDKDMKTIPCTYVRDLDSDPITITEDEAYANFLKQTLSGDVTDGYDGCPGIGSTIADKIIDGGLMKVPYDHELKSGPRKGQVVTRYEEVETDDLWAAVVSHYEAAGLSEEEALRQARVARILHASDYDFKQKEPILWTP